jgi:hypothetical protein
MYTTENDLEMLGVVSTYSRLYEKLSVYALSRVGKLNKYLKLVNRVMSTPYINFKPTEKPLTTRIYSHPGCRFSH